MIGDIARNGLFGLQWMSATARVDVIGKIVTVLVVVAVLLVGGRTGWVAAAMIAPSVLATALLFHSTRCPAGRVRCTAFTDANGGPSPQLALPVRQRRRGGL